MKTYLTFDDVQIMPVCSGIESRSNCVTKTQFTRNYKLNIPLVASPMASICGGKMAVAMIQMGGTGIIHRFNTVEEQLQEVELFKDLMYDYLSVRYGYSPPDALAYHDYIIAAAIGSKVSDFDRAYQLVNAGVNVLVIDVAHGHHSSVQRMLGELVEWRTRSDNKFDIVAGNIATPQAAVDLEKWGADALRVGIGGGSVCETRVRTGVGIPQITCLEEIAEVATVPIISCGGARYPGDVAKAIAAGASTVILGSMISGTTETPGHTMMFGTYGKRQPMKIYHGSASDVQKILTDSNMSNIEGTAAMVAVKGPVANVVDEIMDGLRSAMSYVGAADLVEFYCKSEFVRVTTNGLREAHPHLL